MRYAKAALCIPAMHKAKVKQMDEVAEAELLYFNYINAQYIMRQSQGHIAPKFESQQDGILMSIADTHMSTISASTRHS